MVAAMLCAVRQQRLKPMAGAAGAGVITAEFLDQFLVAVDHAQTTLDLGFRVEIPSGACSGAQKQ